MINDELVSELKRLQDAGYRDFQVKLIPTVDPATIIGVRTPVLRVIAARLLAGGEYTAFLDVLPHALFEENQLHAFILSGIKDYAQCLEGVERFLPYIDNWATCDQLSPKAFKKHTRELIEPITRWLSSGRTYTVRFGIGMLMAHYLDDDFDPAYPKLVAAVRSEEYYIRMMAAWYFATALAKQYPAVIGFIEQRRLDAWTHNKAIQKAIESRRIAPETKAYLRTLRV